MVPLACAFLGPSLDEVAAATPSRELEVTRGTALGAADPLRRPSSRRRGESFAALGASTGRRHAPSVADVADVAAFPALF